MLQTAPKVQIRPGPLKQLSEILQADIKRVDDIIKERMRSDVPLIPKLADYLISAGGKRIRPLLTLATARMYGGDMDKACKLAAAVEFIHTATLLHDDVVDESESRRGKRAANLVFGNQASVLVGDFLFSRAFQLMTETGSIAVLESLSQASAVIAEGEVMQLSASGDIAMTMDGYLEIIRCKTAALFRAACEVGPLVAEDVNEKDVRSMADYGEFLGVSFQISDDILDYTQSVDSMGKEPGDDFREGKITAPVILSLTKSDKQEHDFWHRTMTLQKSTTEDFHTARSILDTQNVLQESLEIAKDFGDKSLKSIEEAPSSDIKTILQDLVPYVISRRS